MAVERRLTEIVGPLGGKIHTARSATTRSPPTWRCWSGPHAARAIALLEELTTTLIELADSHRDWAAPAYTHLQRAQPVYLGHHLLAYFWMFFRDTRRFYLVADSTSDMPAGSGALAGRQLGPRPRGPGRGPRLRAAPPELARRRLQPGLRAGLPVRGLGLRDAPLAPGLGDRALVERGVRLLRARGLVRLRLEHHAPEEEPRRRRAAPRQGPAGRRLAGEPAGHDARAPARLQQGHAGGQGAAVRRDRHARALPRGRVADAGRAQLQPRAARRGLERRASGRDRPRRRAGGARACPSARPTASSPASSGRRSTRASGSPSSTTRRWTGSRTAPRERLREALREGGAIEAKVSAGGTSSARLSEQLDYARRSLADLRALSAPWARRSTAPSSTARSTRSRRS